MALTMNIVVFGPEYPSIWVLGPFGESLRLKHQALDLTRLTVSQKHVIWFSSGLGSMDFIPRADNSTNARRKRIARL